MPYRRLIFISLVASSLIAPPLVLAANDDQIPPPPDVSTDAPPASLPSTLSPPPALPDTQAVVQPPPPVPPEVSNSTPPNSTPSTVSTPPSVPETQPSVMPPAPPDIPTGAVSKPIATPPAASKTNDQPAVEPPAPPPPPEVSAGTPSTTTPNPTTSPATISAAPAQTAIPPASAAPTPDINAYSQALALFKQKQYQDAIPFFKQALAQKPGDSHIYYYLGSCQYKAGHLRDAVMNLGISCKLRPNEKLDYFVRRLRSPLTFQEKQWVDAQVNAYGTGKTPNVPAPIDYPQFGLRLEPQVSFINLAEFTAEVQAQVFYANSQASVDPSYRFSGSVPNSLIGYIVEPVLRMDAHLEFGLPLSVLPAGTVSENIQSALYGNSSISYALSALVGGLDVKLLAGDRPLQFFASIGPRLASIAVNVNYSNPSGSGTSDFNSVVFGGEAQVGLDWEFADNFFLSPSIGYRWLQSRHLTGNVSSGGQSTLSRLEYDPNSSSGSQITIVPEADPDPTGMSPLKVDLSGVTGGLTLSALF